MTDKYEFYRSYCERMEKKMESDLGRPLNKNEKMGFRHKALNHIGIIFPDWNSWSEEKKAEEIKKLPLNDQISALYRTIDGGVIPVYFVLPDKEKVTIMKNLMEKRSLAVDGMLNDHPLYTRKRLFDVMKESPEKTQLKEIANKAAQKVKLEYEQAEAKRKNIEDNGFYESYCERMEKQMESDLRRPLTKEEKQKISYNASRHIGNIFPDWNTWSEQKQADEIKKLPLEDQISALLCTFDGGGVPVYFALPDKEKVTIMQNLMEKDPSLVHKMLNSLNKYRESIFDVMKESAEKIQLKKIANEAAEKMKSMAMEKSQKKIEEKELLSLLEENVQKPPKKKRKKTITVIKTYWRS